VKAERAKGNVIFAHAGDTLSPSLMSGLDRGAHIMTLTNMIRPDVFAPGNHEFDFGKDVFAQRMAEANFPVYAANLRGPDGAPLPGIRDSTIVTIEGIRIGIVGGTYDDTPRTSTPGDLKFLPTVETMRDRADALKRDGADFVVVVVHADRGQDYLLYGSTNIDLVLSGHDHDLFIAYDGRAAVVESSHDAHYVTAIDIDFTVKTENGKRDVVWWPNFRIIDTATVTPDPEVAKVVQGYEAVLARQMDNTIGTTAIELDSRVGEVRAREAAMGDLIADAMRSISGADIAIMNGGGIRGEKVYAPGSTITRRDMLTELPFGNRQVKLEVVGREIKAALENGVSALPQIAGRFPQVSGISFDVDMSRPPGQRVSSVRIGNAPLDDAKSYSVATNDFMAGGGDGYTQFRDAKRTVRDDDAPLLVNQVMDYIEKQGRVDPKVGGRINIK
jgi:2',3'-cyclic-nucleotide 2'-phosphodiesterase (5'-nucleotidase family)